MAESKYYWLKLKRDFFKRHDIRIIEKMPNGKDYVLFYLKLLLESIDHDGSLRFSDTIPYNEDMLSVITDTNIDIVRSAMKLFIGFNMIEVLADDTIFMSEVEKMIGSESKAAERMRKLRENQKLLDAECHNVTDERNTVTQERNNVQNCYIEKEKEKEIQKEKEKEYHSFNQSAFSGDDFQENVDNSVDKERAKRQFLGGSLGKGVVLLSQEQMDNLLDILSAEEFDHYVSVIAEKELQGHKYKRKTHYQAILDMAKQDRKI